MRRRGLYQELAAAALARAHASSLPEICNAQAVAAVCAQSAACRACATEWSLFAQLAVGLGWTAPGGYPHRYRVRRALVVNPTMSRRLAQRFLDVVGATDGDYHTMVHQLECEALDV